MLQSHFVFGVSNEDQMTVWAPALISVAFMQAILAALLLRKTWMRWCALGCAGIELAALIILLVVMAAK